MCDSYENMGSIGFQRAEYRKARKQHDCDECWSRILPGERYCHFTMLWEGSIEVQKTCLFCDRILAAHCAAERSLGGSSSFQAGQLAVQVRECAVEHPEYVVAFRKAWREGAAA